MNNIQPIQPIIVPRNENYVREGVPRFQIPYSLVDDYMPKKERKPTLSERITRVLERQREASSN